MPLPRIRLNLWIPLLLIIPILCLAQPSSAKTQMIDGVKHVLNPATPPNDEATVTPKQLWHLGADEDAPIEELFGYVTQVLVDEELNSYLLDAQLNEIRVFSPDGEFLRNIGRNGEGPGEFRNARQIFFLPENRLGVAQMMPSRIAVLGREGGGFADLPLPGEPSMMRMVENARGAGDHSVLSVMTPLMSNDKMELQKSLRAIGPDGEIVATYREINEVMEGGAMVISFGGGEGDDFSGNWDVDDRGRVFTSPLGDEYMIRVYDPKGPLSHVIRREFESRKRTRAEIAEIEEGFGDIPEGASRPEVPAFDRDIARFETRPGGMLWVFSSRDQAVAEAGRIGPFDVFDGDGNYVKRLSVKADFDPERDEFRVSGNRLYIVKESQGSSATFSGGGAGMSMEIRMGGGDDEEEEEGEAAPLSVICYELPPDC